MTVISIKQDKAVYILDEDNNFVCAHENTEVVQGYDREGNKDTQVYYCHYCDEYLDGSPEFDRADLAGSMAYDECRDN